MWTPIITLVQRWFAVERGCMALGILSAGFGLGFATMGRFYPYVIAVGTGVIAGIIRYSSLVMVI